jgi:hypothetical protein
VRRLKKLATDIDDFEKIIKEGYLYVDKSMFLAKIIESGTYYFLSRPRRFGKSLFLDTIEKFYQGKKELFQGLDIYDFDWDWEEYPILRLDFNRLEHSTTENLKIELEEFLDNYAVRYNVKLNSTLVSSKFEELIIKMSNITNKKVVVLIDEYDKAIISHLSQDQKEIKIAKENQNFLKTLYDNLKPLVKYLELVFITGVSKFSKLSIFSTLNNLNELDMHPQFSHMLGYTEDELRDNFDPYFKEFAAEKGLEKEEIYRKFKQMYNGFRFSDEDVRVYNPYSIARALEAKKIDNYWFESGTPAFLVELVKNKRSDVSKLENLEVGKDELKAYDIEQLELIPLLFQTGYLTIKEIEDQIIYKLGYPNLEVKKGFNLNLAKSFSQNKINVPVVHRLRKALINKKLEEFTAQMKSIFASLANINIPKSLQGREAYYNSIFYLTATLLTDNNFNVYSEILTSEGRIDMTVETETNIFIIEFKCNQAADKALAQIKNKNYAESLKLKDKEIILIGINFDTEIKNIEDIKIEK